MLKINNNTVNNSAAYRSPNFRGLTIGPKAAKALNKIGSLQSPGQRMIFGVSALALQPALDMLNPWVDKDTKETSAIRSVAKAIVSTATGVVIRELCILGTDLILNSKNLTSKLPATILKDTKHSAGVIGTLMGLGIMVFTNFLLDAPWTNKFTNMLLKIRHNKNNKQAPAEKNAAQPKAPAPEIKQYMQASQVLNNKNINELPISQVNKEVLKCAF